MKFLLSFAFSILCIVNYSFACQASDADCIYISSMTVMGTDNVILCNSCATDITLSGGVMVVDNNPANTETLADTTIPGLGCVTLVEDVDFSFGFSASNGDGFTLSCADGTVIVTKSFGPTSNPVVFCAPQPMTCNAAAAGSVYISKVIYDGVLDDQIIVCNSSTVEVVLTGITISDSGSSEMLVNPTTIPPLGCVALVRNVDFTFGLGDNETVTISCGADVFDTVTYDQDGQDLECFIAADSPVGPCDPGVTSIFISTVNTDTDVVVVCNDSPVTVSLDGVEISDENNTETLFGVTIPPFGCVEIIRDVHFTFGLGSDDSFTIECEGTTVASETWTMLDGEFEFNPPPVPSIAGIPTMGEWGLICLSMLFMIFGVVLIKEEKLVLVKA